MKTTIIKKFYDNIENGSLYCVFRPKYRNYGRLVHSTEHKANIQTLFKNFRHYVLSNRYVEIDMKSCHPTIVKEIAGIFNINTTEFNKYLLNREDMAKIHGVSSEHLKTGVLSKLYGGNPFKNPKALGSYSSKKTKLLAQGIFAELDNIVNTAYKAVSEGNSSFMPVWVKDDLLSK